LISNKLKAIGRNYLDRLWYVLEAEVPKVKFNFNKN
jgi:hypothetical protein